MAKVATKYLIFHCTDTPEGREVTKSDIYLWHLGPAKQPNGTWKYLGKFYKTIDALPQNEYIPNTQITPYASAKAGGGRGWQQVGYTDLIMLNGDVVRLAYNNNDEWVDSNEITNGATGFNSNSRHVVYAGGMDKITKKAKDTRTPAQKDTMKDYVLNNMLKIAPNVIICGHRDVSAKPCPSFVVQDFLKEIGVPEKNIGVRGKNLPK